MNCNASLNNALAGWIKSLWNHSLSLEHRGQGGNILATLGAKWEYPGTWMAWWEYGGTTGGEAEIS